MNRLIKILLVIVLIPCAAYALVLIGVFAAGLTGGITAVDWDEPCERDRAGYCLDGRP